MTVVEEQLRDDDLGGEAAAPDPIRIAIIFDWFWSYVVPQALALQKAGAEVLIVCRTHSHEFDGLPAERAAYVKLLRESGVGILELSGRVSSPGSWAAAVRLRRELRAFAPDVVHVHQHHDPRLMILGAGVPAVLTLHDPRPHAGTPGPRGWRRFVASYVRRNADLIIVHGAELAHQLSPSVRKRTPTLVVPHGVDVKDHPIAVSDQPNVLFFGRLEPYKGLDILLAAMERVWVLRPDARLTVAGRGSLRPPSRRDERIDVINRYIQVDELEDLFASARLVVLPYTDASQSGVGTYAVARGIPVIVTRAGSLTDLVTGEEYIVEPADVEALAAAIVRHLDHSIVERRFVLAHARNRLSWDRVTARMLLNYRQVAR